MVRYIPYVRRKITEARNDTINSVNSGMAKSVKGHKFINTLPEKGFSKVRHFFKIKIQF